MIAQLKHQVKIGSSVRMMFKIGKFIVKGGEVNWRSFREDDRMSRTFHNHDGASHASTNYSKQMVNSVQRKELSVMTPSIAKTRTQS
mmetsp:Transcript_6386/g.10351  ORF Transcript_6386/g.10351 Transcript_6386/m.10351 type:complete len:87 (+) Transcript_6386:359-619(+)